MRRQNKKWVGGETDIFPCVGRSRSLLFRNRRKPPLQSSESDQNGSARPPEDQRRGSSRASPQAAHDGDEAPGQAPLAETRAHHTKESGAGGAGAGTLSSSKRARTTRPHPVLFPFGRSRSLTVDCAAEAANSGIQFYNFSSKTQSRRGPRRQQMIFRKSFRIA